ncbi:MAG: cytidylate kinase-like family protein [Prevotellaceae bacterium]|jgi:cytidylate kinase|nr:cytidylate kinase-like family protein [Prevotellaceae bacterium]
MEHFVINIGRQLGSGGREIGVKLADRLQAAYYDKELIALAARESGIGTEFFEKADEVATFSLANSIHGLGSGNMNHFQSSNFLCNESLFKIQSDVIKKLAEKQTCIFVGRCADYVLRENPRCLNVFITADIECRINRVVRTYQMTSESKAKELIQKTDKKRAAYYNYYTNKQWGVASSYHLCINTSALGEEKTVDFIAKFAGEKLGIK